VDGGIVIRSGCTFSFDDLLQRFHFAESRIEKLSNTDPAQVIVSDLLVTTDGRSLVELTFDESRARLEDSFVKNLAVDPILQLSPSSERPSPINRPNATAGEDQKPAQHRLNLSSSRSRRSFQDASVQFFSLSASSALSPHPLFSSKDKLNY
jgi:hypothetical protein